ncbi:MAG: hypothetical protein M3081_00865 [Gemmatimonadota bacterium]|nr:hypothetical protein [Gemmatimonadota bacterium]
MMDGLFPLSPEISLAPGGAAWIASQATAVIADVHLGYARAARRRGGYLPTVEHPEEIAARVVAMCLALGATRLVIAGDLRHSTRDADKLELDDVAAFRAQLLKDGALERVDLVAGNHDRGDASAVARIDVDGVEIVHEPPAELPDRWTICGHLHPSTTLRDETGAGMRVPCALVAQRLIVLPAFSEWSGGTSASRLVRSLPPADWRQLAMTHDRIFQI